MKSLTCTLLAIFVAMCAAKAQDQLFRTDNTRLSVKVIEVGPKEIKYKLSDNPSGPTYAEKRENVGLIIYQNGEHEVISSTASVPVDDAYSTETVAAPLAQKMSVSDSLIYYEYSNNISINFLNFFNNELGIMYQREFFHSQFNIILPFAFGVARPGVTDAVYFKGGGPVSIALGNKVIEAGFGIHYYPSLKTNANYFIGPMMRFMQYNCTQQAASGTWGYTLASNNTTLTRYAFTITNGMVIRTRSRLTATLFGSIGFKRDEVADELTDAFGETIVTIPNPVSLYWWSGFQVGFNF